MGQALRRYYRGATLAAMVDVATGERFNYKCDHQGTVQCLTDMQGNVTDRFASDAWGVPVKREGTSINRQWYVGNLGYYRQVDQALDYVRARYYGPEIAAWLSVDPVYRTDLYWYAKGRVSLDVDPTGLYCAAPGDLMDNCPKPCDRDPADRPVPPPQRPDCRKMLQQLPNTLVICQADRSGDLNFPRGQAFTTCCSKEYRKPARGCHKWDEELSSTCITRTGCIKTNGGGNGLGYWNNLPAVFRLCTWEHEQRRKELCRCSRGDTNGGTAFNRQETDRVLACVQAELRRCNLEARAPDCRPVFPPLPFKPDPSKGCIW